MSETLSEIEPETVCEQTAKALLWVIACLLKNEPASCRISVCIPRFARELLSLSNLCCGGAVKARMNSPTFTLCGRPETRWSNYEQGEPARNGEGRPEPVYVAMCWDDLLLAVKCQTNLEIAGSPRKVYRDRLLVKRSWGRALNGISRGNLRYFNQTPEYNCRNLKETDMRG